MPRKILETATFDQIEDESLYTRAALKADPDAKGLLSLTDSWLPETDKARAEARKAREAKADADARRAVANGRLDAACIGFGDALYLEEKKDRASKRWSQFFKDPVSRFVRQPLARQVNVVKAWLASSDPLVAKMKGELDTWSKAAEQALVETEAQSEVRGKAWIAREKLAEDLTAGRDGLHEALAALARQKGLGRGYADLFFRVQPRPEAAKFSVDEPSATAPTAATTAPTTRNP